jgi:hypothetical protein
MADLFEKIEYLHVQKGYTNLKKDISHHRLLPGMVKLLGYKQDQINYLQHYASGGGGLADYDIFRYRKINEEKL